jgi:hypothetical protein
MAEYVARHAPEQVTERFNAVCDAIGFEPDPFLHAAAFEVLHKKCPAPVSGLTQ